MKRLSVILLIISLICIANSNKSIANGPTDYLVCQDVGIFKKYGCSCGSSAGVLGPAGHFGEDHNDISCDVTYHSMSLRLAVKSEVTQHAGSDSDKWLLHEVDIEFRNYYGMPGYYIKTINGNTVFVYGSGGRDYRWLSDNKVVMIEYHDSQVTKPEPLEIIQAYLAKHPSTLPSITMNELNSAVNKTIWIKDEMDRRLWLGGKWMGQIKTAGDLDKLRDVVKNLNVFLDYREKYYGIEIATEKNALFTAQQSKNKAAIEDKLNDYFKWWNENKDKPINL